MATYQIEDWVVQQYTQGVRLLSQQKGSRLFGTVQNEGKVVGERIYFDRMHAAEANLKTTRNADTPDSPDLTDRRSGIIRQYNWAKLVDSLDKLLNINEATNPYFTSAMWAMGRKQDSIIIEALGGTSYSGVAGATSVALPSGQKIAVASTGLTLAKLISAKEILDASDLDPDEERYCLVTAAQVSDLLSTTEVKSADYNEVKALVEGKIDTFMGFRFKRTQRLLTDGSSSRLVLCYVRSAAGVYVGSDVVSDIGPRRDKSMSTQIYLEMSMGATRIEDEGVVEIACAE